ncbi:MAG: MotA/TolQ/ExbB proton channel family protein, partial [Gemmatimonadota bacterium]
MNDTSYELLTIFVDGGFMMYPLVLCSLAALGVILAKAWTLNVAHRDSQELLHDIEALGTTGELEKAIERAHETRGPV